MRWSYSRLSLFHNCKYAFYLNYILNDPVLYPPEGNFYSENGKFVHEILEKVFKKEIDLDEAASLYTDDFGGAIKNPVRQSIMDKKFEACAEFLSTVDFDWMNDYEILGVEKEMHFSIGEKEFIAYIDLLLRDKTYKDIIIIDHKSGAYPFGKNSNVLKNYQDTFLSYQRQMNLYAAAVYQEYGEYPSQFCWNFFSENRYATIRFNKATYRDVIKWAEDTIQEIEQEEEFDPNMNFFYCTQLCSFRSSCEYAQNADWS